MKRIRLKSIDYLISNRLKQLKESDFTVVKDYEVVDPDTREFSLGLHCKNCNTCFLQKFTTKYKSLPTCPVCSIIKIEQTLSKSTYKFLYESDGYIHFKCSGCNSLKRYTSQMATKTPADCVECKKIACIEHLDTHNYAVENIQGSLLKDEVPDLNAQNMLDTIRQRLSSNNKDDQKALIVLQQLSLMLSILNQLSRLKQSLSHDRDDKATELASL